MNTTRISIPPAPHLKRGFEILKPLLPEDLSGMQILDAGCGEGRNSLYLAQLGFTVFGVDADYKSICTASDALNLEPNRFVDERKIRYSQQDIGSMGFREGHLFNGVVCNETLHQLPLVKRQTTLKQLMGLTRSGGFHIFSDYVGPVDTTASVRPWGPGKLREMYDTLLWDVLDYHEEPYKEITFGDGATVINSIACIVAVKP